MAASRFDRDILQVAVLMRNITSLLRALPVALLLPVATPAQTQVIKIWNGAAPGSENWTQPESVIAGSDTNRVVNVSVPTLTVYRPEKGKETGTGVIIAPGGGFVHLAIQKEGNLVASWLQQRGIAGFVLKYRLRQRTPEEIKAAYSRTPGARPPAAAGGVPSMDEIGQYGIADGIQALKILRQRAAEFGLSPEKIGIMGFSAGGMVASGVLLQADAAARPSFAAPIYGAPFGAIPPIPQNLPPVFLAWAQDDRLAAGVCGRFYEALKAAGPAPEVHIYKAGGHGFGMSKQGTTSDYWIEDFYHWLQALGFAK